MQPEGTVYFPSTPLWYNPHLPHFDPILNHIVWADKVIIQLKDIMGNGQLPTFDDLKWKFQLPNWYFFCYLQLRHAYKSQFGMVQSSDLERLQEAEH